ncbi:MAG TPA: hypothetical protein VK522_18315, partial [Pseudolabrys sp.]|nr:hypothetical protein [Pseudolabrys sp.]
MSDEAEPKRMTAAEYRAHLDRLDLSQNAASRLFNVNPKTGRRWASLTDPADIPRAVEIALELLTPRNLKKFLPATAAPA